MQNISKNIVFIYLTNNMYIYIHICMYVCMYVCIYIYMYVYIIDSENIVKI